MSYTESKSGEITVSGFDKGVGISPHKGLGNMQGVNLATESGEAMCSFNRVPQQQIGTTGTLTQINTNTVSVSGITLKVGEIITITNAGTTGLKIPFTPITSVSALVVAGGGGGGASTGTSAGGGGGGAGGLLTDATHAVTVGAYSVTVGAGGGPSTSGSNSVFDTLTTIGGGHGGIGTGNGANGGSGGGAGQTSATGGSGTALQGNAGGTSGASSAAAGGGGAGAVGANGVNPNAGNGGVGVSSSISGSATFYAGGGGGGNGNNGGTTGTGGNGGGGAGGTGTIGANGMANTGGGGGGGSAQGAPLAGGSGGSGVVIISYPTQTSAAATGGTITTSGGNTIHTFTTSGTFTVLPSQTGNYYYLSGANQTTGKLYGGTTTTGSLPPNDPDSTTAVSGITAGTATFIITYPLGQPYQSATETYHDSNYVTQYRYYILDSSGNIWCHDTTTLVNWDTPQWFFIGNVGSGASGLAVYNGWLFVTNGVQTLWKLTVLLGNAFSNSTNISSLFGFAPRVSVVGHNATLFVSDGNTVATWFADTTLVSGFSNIQSYGQYTAVSIIATLVDLISGNAPSVGVAADRIPAMFYTNGTLPSAINTATIYYIDYIPGTPDTFKVFSAASGGSALDLQTGATGKQYFNTFDATTSAGQTMLNFSFQNLFLPTYEQITSMAELGGQMVIGGIKNALYLWDEISAQYSSIIFLPENGTAQLITVNNTVYAFTGNKGNIYITNGSAASPVISVPDYCAGIPGTPLTYIEPYFTWGAAMYVRGRVFFSILDQTSTKAGNCGGIWSFIPTQNFFIGNDTGLSLRLENQNSYGTYSGVATVLLPSQNQLAIAPQYWSGWYSDVTAPVYGIDFTGTLAQVAMIETDLIPTGTLLDKRTFSQIEYKLAAPLLSGDSVAINYRKTPVDAWTSCGTLKTESNVGLSGYYSANFQDTQWVQLQVVMTPGNPSSFIRMQGVTLR